MVPVIDVAERLLQRTGPTTTMKLQKLVYYTQVWHLTWLGERLFEEPIEAWKRGPVVRSLFNQHSKLLSISTVNGSPTLNAGPVVDGVIEFVLAEYGSLSGDRLSELTHNERPWIDAYTAGKNTEITPESIVRFYSEDTETVEAAWFWAGGVFRDAAEADAQIEAGVAESYANADDFLTSLD